MKALFVCAAGMNRSHALVLQTKQLWSWDALAAGVWANPSVFPMLSAWADRIVLVERWWPEHFIPTQHCTKVAWLEMGMDIWGSPKHPDLYQLAETLINHWAKAGFKPGLVVHRTGRIEEVQSQRPVPSP